MSSFVKVIDKGLQALLYAKFKDILGLKDFNSDTVFWPKEVAFRQISEKRGRAVVEFFNLWRETSNFSWDRQRTAVARRDMLLNYVDPAGKTSITTARAIPVDLTYDVWFWTKDLDKYNQIVEEYAWWRHEDPNLNINYNDTYPLELDLHFGDVIDESTTPEMFDKGLYYVLRAPITVDGWLMKDFTVKTIKRIVLSIYDEEVPSDPQLLATETLVVDESSS